MLVLGSKLMAMGTEVEGPILRSYTLVRNEFHLATAASKFFVKLKPLLFVLQVDFLCFLLILITW